MAHTLNDYLTLLEREGLLAAPVPADLDREQPIALVSCDSRTVVPGTLFVCKGAHFKAEFLDMAQSRGAVAYASEKRWPDSPLPCILLSDLRRAMALMADLCYDHPSGKLKVIGFTGTKGKSSATYYLKSVLDAYRSRQGKGETGVISSIDTYDGAERFESHLTTPEPLDLQRHLAHAAQAGLEYLTMEVSSQALKYHRSLCTEFAAACFLNIGYDHISPIEHPDFQDYFTSKLKIFGQAQVNCVNLDCDHAPEVLAAAQAAGKPVITFSQKNPQADVYASSVRKEDGQTVFQVRTPSYEREFRLTMPGLFNGVPADHARAVQRGERPGGHRRVRGPAHPRLGGVRRPGAGPGARADGGVLQRRRQRPGHCVREEYPGRNMAIVFGCPGKKAFDRRHDLGEAAGQWCDRVYLTEEDSGEEDTLAICREIAPNVEKEGCPVQIIPNRGEAIRRAVLDSQWPSILLLTGKGRETRQKRGIEYIDTPTDVEYVQAFLQEYDLIHRLDPASPAKAALSVLPALEERQGETWVVYAPPEGLSALLDGPALARAGARVVLVRPQGGELPPALSGSGVALSAGDGGLLKHTDTGINVRPKVLDTLLAGGFLPVLTGSGEEAAAVAQAMKADRLVLFVDGEPSLALGEDRQVELLHMNLIKADELLKEGALPTPTADALKLACRGAEGGVKKNVLLPAGEEHVLLLEALGQRVMGVSVTP